RNHAIERLRKERFPFVAVVYEPDSADVCTVNSDDFGGGKMAAQHLLALGHRKIAHLAGETRVATAEPRKAGFLSALEKAAVDCQADWIVPASFSWKGGMEATNRLLDMPASRRPTALFAANDLCAEGAFRALRARGLNAPDDMAVVGYDDTWFASMTRPQLTSVHMPIAEMSAAATRIVIDLVAGKEIENRQPVLPVSLTIRESRGASFAHPTPSRYR